MNNKKFIYFALTLFVLLLISACGTESSTGPADTANTEPTEISPTNNASQEDNSAVSDNEILIIIDQTPKPIEGNSFDFVVKQVPEGYSLAEIQWISEKSKVINTVQEAIAHGASGGDGFYISGDGQFSGFFYPDAMKGEKGQVIFLFRNEQGKELTWKKEVTLN